MESVSNTTLGSKINHLIHHIARTSHTETHVACAMQYHIGSLNEVFRSLLHSYTTKEGNDLFFACMVRTRNVLKLLTKWINSIMNSEALARILMILVDNSLASELRYTHDTVCIVHTILLYAVNGRVYLTTTTVEVSSMNMDAERLTTNLLSMNTCRES